MKPYHLARFDEGESWNLLCEGFLLGSLIKIDGLWAAASTTELDGGRRYAIEKFIDSQHFNRLPDKIRIHWEKVLREVIMENDSLCIGDFAKSDEERLLAEPQQLIKSSNEAFFSPF